MNNLLSVFGQAEAIYFSVLLECQLISFWHGCCAASAVKIMYYDEPENRMEEFMA